MGNKKMTPKKGHKWKVFLVVVHVCRIACLLRMTAATSIFLVGGGRESELSLKFQEV